MQNPGTSLDGRRQNLDHLLEQVGTLGGVPYVVKGKAGFGSVVAGSTKLRWLYLCPYHQVPLHRLDLDPWI